MVGTGVYKGTEWDITSVVDIKYRTIARPESMTTDAWSAMWILRIVALVRRLRNWSNFLSDERQASTALVAMIQSSWKYSAMNTSLPVLVFVNTSCLHAYSKSGTGRSLVCGAQLEHACWPTEDASKNCLPTFPSLFVVKTTVQPGARTGHSKKLKLPLDRTVFFTRYVVKAEPYQLSSFGIVGISASQWGLEDLVSAIDD